MTAYDDWIYRRVEATLLWLEEWLSVSQKTVERTLLVVYLGLYLMAVHYRYRFPASIHACFALTISYFMWNVHRVPTATRRGILMPPGYKRMRVLMQAFSVFIGTLFIASGPHDYTNYMWGTAQVFFMLFWYVCSVGSNGERGRRRKLAWAELKKMFGTEWIPKPAGVEG